MVYFKRKEFASKRSKFFPFWTDLFIEWTKNKFGFCDFFDFVYTNILKSDYEYYIVY